MPGPINTYGVTTTEQGAWLDGDFNNLWTFILNSLDATVVKDSQKVGGFLPSTIPTAGRIPIINGSGQLPLGSAGILFNDGTTQTTAATGGGGGAVTIPTLVVVTAAGTTSWVVPAAITRIRGKGWGGSGASNYTSASVTGGGGGGGEYREDVIVVTPGETLTLTVGSAGVVGGANGGPTSIKRSATVLLQANGGANGASGVGGAGGTGGTGLIGMPGQSGGRLTRDTFNAITSCNGGMGGGGGGAGGNAGMANPQGTIPGGGSGVYATTPASVAGQTGMLILEY